MIAQNINNEKPERNRMIRSMMKTSAKETFIATLLERVMLCPHMLFFACSGFESTPVFWTETTDVVFWAPTGGRAAWFSTFANPSLPSSSSHPCATGPLKIQHQSFQSKTQELI